MKKNINESILNSLVGIGDIDDGIAIIGEKKILEIKNLGRNYFIYDSGIQEYKFPGKPIVTENIKKLNHGDLFFINGKLEGIEDIFIFIGETCIGTGIAECWDGKSEKTYKKIFLDMFSENNISLIGNNLARNTHIASNTIDSYFIEIKLGPFTKQEYDEKMEGLKKVFVK